MKCGGCPGAQKWELEDIEMATASNSRVLRTMPLMLIMVLLCPLASGKIIYVDDDSQADFDVIQAGIDAAIDGDTVLVASGEYIITEPVTFRGKAITVMSETGPDETTIRMGTPTDPNRGSAVVFENNETAASVLDGFTITGGTGCWFWLPEESEFDWVGGGICFFNSSATVQNCAIVQNRAEGSGGGVACGYDSSVTMNNCIIAANSAGESGGGVCCDANSLMTFADCIIRDNSANVAAGVLCWTDSSITMTDCAIMSNTATNCAGGFYVRASAVLTNCLIARNIGLSWGGGGVMSSYPDASVTISNCTIWGNSGGSHWGGGGVLCRNASLTVTNSIVWGNTSPKGREISVQDPASTLTIAYSDVGGGRSGVNVEGGCTLNWGVGNIDADPLFAKPGYWGDINDPNMVVEPDDPNATWVDGDYHLKSEAGR